MMSETKIVVADGMDIAFGDTKVKEDPIEEKKEYIPQIVKNVDMTIEPYGLNYLGEDTIDVKLGNVYEFPHKALGRVRSLKGKRQGENVCERIALCSGLNDIRDVNYNKYGKKDDIGLKQISGLFIDNIIFFSICPENIILIPKKKVEKVKKIDLEESDDEDEDEDEKKTMTGVKCTELGGIMGKIVEIFGEYGIKLKKTCLMPTKIVDMDKYTRLHLKWDRKEKPEKGYYNRRAKRISCKRFVPNWDNSIEDRKFYLQKIKVSLADYDSEELFKMLGDKAFIKLLRKNSLFIHDIDTTVDFSGSFNRQDIEDHLVEEHGFRLQGSKGIDSDATIIDNKYLVGNNCLTFMSQYKKVPHRYKIYNKFAQSLESQSVRKKYGSHLTDWINNSEKRLEETIPKSMERGYTRLEITSYYYGNCKRIPDSKDVYYENLDRLYKYISKEVIYSTPIEKQWESFQEKLSSSLLIYNKSNNSIYVVYWHNSLTKRYAWVKVGSLDERKIKHVLDFCTYKNLPIILFIFEEFKNEKKDYIRLVAREYHKTMKDGFDIVRHKYIKDKFNVDLLDYPTLLHPIKEKGFRFDMREHCKKDEKVGKFGNNPEDRGIIPTPNVCFKYMRGKYGKMYDFYTYTECKRDHVRFTLYNCTQRFKLLKGQGEIEEFEKEANRYIAKLERNGAKKQKEIREEIMKKELKIRKLAREAKTASEKCQIESNKENRFKRRIVEILGAFEKRALSLSTIDIGDFIKVNALRPIRNRFGSTYILCTRYGDCYFANYQIREFLKDKCMKDLTLHDGIYVLDDIRTIITVKITGRRKTSSGLRIYCDIEKNKYEDIDATDFSNMKAKCHIEKKLQGEIQKGPKKLPEIKVAVRLKDCHKIDDLYNKEDKDKNVLKVIKAIKGHWKKERYLLEIEGIDEIVYTNPFITESIKQDNPNLYSFEIILGVAKLDKTKHTYRTGKVVLL